jgi:hypothetical protein
LKRAKDFLPTHNEIETWWMKGITASIKKDPSYHYMDDVRVFEVGTEKEFDNELWTIFKVHASSFKQSEGTGRLMLGCIGFDTPAGFKLLGICSLHENSHTSGVGNSHIGWTDSQRAANKKHLVNMTVCVPTQPFGFNRVGGKFVSLAALDLIPSWEKKYDTKIVGVITTSLHNTQSQYNGMKRFWESFGTTSDSMSIIPDQDRYNFWREWLKTNYPNTFNAAQVQTQSSSEQVVMKEIYKLLDIDKLYYEQQEKRNIFLCPLYRNYKDFLCNQIKEKDLDTKQIDWHAWWHFAAHTKFEKILKEKRTQIDQLWIGSINDIDIKNLFC